MRQSFNKLAKKTATFITAAAIALSVSFGALAQDNNELIIPGVPANFEVAEFQGQKGCVPYDQDYVLAVSINSGTKVKGTQLAMQSPKNGMYNEHLFYNENKGFGYILSDKQDGKICVIDKVYDVSFGSTGSFDQVVFDGEITKNLCDKIPYRFEGVCGSFNGLTSKLSTKGFSLQWQGLDREGNIKTLLTSQDKTYVLTTDSTSNATVLTAASTHSKYKNNHEKEPVNAPDLVAALK
jgi:hypothetical protein